MINKENEDNATGDPELESNGGFVDVAKMDVQCHLIIKDKDTGEVLVNKRG